MTTKNTNNNPVPIAIPDVSQPLIFFSIITILYSGFRYLTTKVDQLNNDGSIKANSSGILWTIIYVLLLIVGNYFINLNITSSICGSVQWTNTLITTIIPWIFVFATIVLLLMMLPSWLSPFSNTIGYLIAKVMGLNTLFSKILKSKINIEIESKNNTKVSLENEIVSDNLQTIYSDRSLLINEITQTNFNEFWDNLKNAGLLQRDLTKENNLENKIALYNFIVLKDTIAEFIWYLLTGLLVTSISYNYIVNSTCTTNVMQMSTNYKAQTLKNQQNQQNKNNHSYSNTISGDTRGSNEMAIKSMTGIETSSQANLIYGNQQGISKRNEYNQNALSHY